MTDVVDLAADADRPLVGVLWRHGRGHARYAVAGLVGMLLARVPATATPFLIGVGLDAVLSNERAYVLPLVPAAVVPETRVGQLWFTAGLFLAIAVTHSSASYLRGWAWNTFAQHVQHDVRVAAYRDVQALGLQFFDDAQSGEVVSVLNNDVEAMETCLTEHLRQAVHVVIFVAVTAAFMVALNWQLAVVAFAVAPLMVVGNYWFAGRVESIQAAVQEQLGRLHARLQNNVSGVATVKAFGAEAYESERLAEASRDYRDAGLDAVALRAAQYPGMRVLTGLGFAVTFAVAGYWTLRGPPPGLTGTMTAGALVTFVFYTRHLMWPMRSVTNVVDGFKSSRAAAARIRGVATADRRIDDPADPVELGEVAGAVTYDDATFAYRADRPPVVDGVSVEVAPGEAVGVVGPTGAGKSTLVKLLLRFYDVDDGAVRLDGHDVRNLRRSDMRGAVGYVSQEPFLFDGTVAENVAYGRPGADRAEIREAAEVAAAHRFVRELPDGYDTRVGERGVKLSGGQRQRLAIARTVLADQPVVVLDEATSHVDNETEVDLQRNLAAFAEERTTIAVAHRLSTVRHADTILVVDDGRVVERGTHEELVERDGLYADLWRVQVGEADAVSRAFLEAAEARADRIGDGR